MERALLAARDGEAGAFTETDDEVVEALLDLPADAGGWESALAIMRVGDRAEAIGGVGRIQEMADEDDSESGRRHLARVLGLLLTRHGPLEPDVRTQLIELIDPIYPTGIYDTDRVLVEVLVALDDPSVIESTLPLIEAADRQETAILFLHALRLQKSGWDDASRSRIMSALDRAKSYSGGASLPGV